MTTGIMLLVMYGDEIWDWTKNLFSAKKAWMKSRYHSAEMTEIEELDGRAQNGAYPLRMAEIGHR